MCPETQDDAEQGNKDLDAAVLTHTMFPICFCFKDRFLGFCLVTCTAYLSMRLNCLHEFPQYCPHSTESSTSFYVCCLRMQVEEHASSVFFS